MGRKPKNIKISNTEIKVKSLLSKRITKEMLIQKTRLEKVLSKYDIIPSNYTIESPDNKRKYLDTDEGPLPDRIIFHGDFILSLKEEDKNE